MRGESDSADYVHCTSRKPSDLPDHATSAAPAASKRRRWCSLALRFQRRLWTEAVARHAPGARGWNWAADRRPNRAGRPRIGRRNAGKRPAYPGIPHGPADFAHRSDILAQSKCFEACRHLLLPACSPTTRAMAIQYKHSWRKINNPTHFRVSKHSPGVVLKLWWIATCAGSCRAASFFFAS
jgi:hypothetical protein